MKGTLIDYNINNRHRLTMDVIFTLKQPLSHIGKTTGNVSNLNTIGVRDLTGQPCETFIYSGNAIRNGILRRVGIMGTLDALELDVPPDIHQMLFSGGRIDGSIVNDMGAEERMRRLFPALSVLGTAKPSGALGIKQSMMLAGRMSVGHGWLICYEAARSIPRRFLPIECSEALAAVIHSEEEFQRQRSPDGITDLWTDGNEKEKVKLKRLREAHLALLRQHIPLLRSMLKSWHELATVNAKYRHDSLKDSALRSRLITLPAEKQLKAPKQQSLLGEEEEAHEEKVEAKQKSDSMIMTDRLIRAGCQLYSRWDVNVTSVEEGFIYSALTEFAKAPYIGGKDAAGGNGLVDVEIFYRDGKTSGRLMAFGQDVMHLSERAEEKKAEYDRYVECLAEYKNFLADGKTEISKFLAA